MEFITVHGTQKTKPSEVECCGNTVFVRKDIHRVTVTSMDESVEMWEYLEAKVPMDEFMNYFAKQTLPYTETKTAYIGDTEVTFSNRPGNLTVYFPHPYTVERLTDRIIVSFDELEEVTDITISIL